MSDERRDYAAEVIAEGKAPPENPNLYNVIRASLDYWWDFTTAEVYAAEAAQREGDPWPYRDGLARRLVADLRNATATPPPTPGPS